MTIPAVRVLEPNTKGRDFVVADIHGAFDLLERALKDVNFDPAKDRVIAIGDLIDRGPQSDQCLHYLSQPWFHAVRGNHEEMFMQLYEDGVFSHRQIIESEIVGMKWILDQPRAFLDRLRDVFSTLPHAIEIPTPEGVVGCVHADIPPDMSWQNFCAGLEAGDEGLSHYAIWSDERIKYGWEEGVPGAARVFFGHRPVEGAKALGNCFFVDTGGVFKVVGTDRGRDYFLQLTDVRAAKEEILNPGKSSPDGLVRVALQRPPAAPAAKPRAPSPKP